MVEDSGVTLDRVFGAVADPTRRAILAMLAEKPATVTEIARPFPFSLNAVSKHLMVLERAGLIRREVTGREHHCHIEATPLLEAGAWLDHYRRFWNVRLDALERHVIAKKKASIAQAGAQNVETGKQRYARDPKADSRHPRRGVRRVDRSRQR